MIKHWSRLGHLRLLVLILVVGVGLYVATGVVQRLADDFNAHAAHKMFSRSGVAQVEVEGLASPVAVEVASTAQARDLGLMGRASLAPGSGMLFVYDDSAPREFWMKDTLIALDIAWVHDGHVVGITTMQPCLASDDPLALPAGPCPTYPSPGPVEMVLEVPAGTMATVPVGASVAVLGAF